MAVASKYHNVLISDHSPHSLDFKLSIIRQMNNNLLKDTHFCDYLREKIYFVFLFLLMTKVMLMMQLYGKL